MNNIKVKKCGRKQINEEAFNTISGIKRGEYIIFPKKDWKLKMSPGANMLRKRLGREYRVETLTDESGWRITAL